MPAARLKASNALLARILAEKHDFPRPDFNPYLGTHAKSGILVESSAPQGVGGARSGTIVERRVATLEGFVRVVKGEAHGQESAAA